MSAGVWTSPYLAPGHPAHGLATRFDASTDRLLRTTDLFDHDAPYAVMGWFYLTSDLNTPSVLLSINDDGENDDTLLTGLNGTVVSLGVTGGLNEGTTNMVVGVWYHLAMVRESTTLLRSYVNGVPEDTDTTSVSRVAPARFEIGALTSSNGNRFNGRSYNLKAWSTALNAGEVRREMLSHRPVSKLQALHGWWWGPPGAPGLDFSPHRRHFTVVGTLTQEAPPQLWRPSLYLPAWLEEGGGAAELAGSSAGTSTAGATAIQLPHALAGSSAGASTAGANLSTAKPLDGASAGTSTAGGDLSTAKPLAGSSAGTSTAGATTLNQTQPLAGASAGTSTASADLSVVSGAGAVLEGASAGTSTAAVDTLRLNHALVGASAGTSTAGATLRMQHALVASSAGTSTAGADLLTAKPLVGSSAGTSTAGVTTLRLTHPLTASTAGTSTAAATLRMQHPLVGSAAGVATVAGTFVEPVYPGMARPYDGGGAMARAGAAGGGMARGIGGSAGRAR